jgi:hypothetical protein
MRMPSIAGMELLAATAREVTETAADSSAFSQENFITGSSNLVLSPPQEERMKILVTVVRRQK